MLPLITSCSPGWIKFVEHTYPDSLAHLSTCKSPHTMLGALIKSYYAGKIKREPKDIFVVSIMPCTAKKSEIVRPEMQNDGLPNVDAVLTTRELANMIKEMGIDFNALPDEEFDNPLGMSTGAADIFGLTGGVMGSGAPHGLRTGDGARTAVRRPARNSNRRTGAGQGSAITIEKPLPDYAFLDGVTVRVAVTSGLAGAEKLMEQVADGTSPYHFIEVMGCPGGCIMGGGQPRSDDPDVRTKRLRGLYSEDEGKGIRKSHENPFVAALYSDYLEHPNGHKSHELLHTHYVRRGKFNEFTGERFDLGTRPAQKKRDVAAQEIRAAQAATQESKHAREDLESVRVLALEAENTRLKAELADVTETVGFFKNVIADYASREK